MIFLAPDPVLSPCNAATTLFSKFGLPSAISRASFLFASSPLVFDKAFEILSKFSFFAALADRSLALFMIGFKICRSVILPPSTSYPPTSFAFCINLSVSSPANARADFIAPCMFAVGTSVKVCPARSSALPVIEWSFNHFAAPSVGLASFAPLASASPKVRSSLLAFTPLCR